MENTAKIVPGAPPFYLAICEPRLKAIEETQADAAASMGEIREKIFNGFGESIEQTKNEVHELKRSAAIAAVAFGAATIGWIVTVITFLA